MLTAVLMQTAVTAYFSSNHLLLFGFTGQYSIQADHSAWPSGAVWPLIWWREANSHSEHSWTCRSWRGRGQDHFGPEISLPPWPLPLFVVDVYKTLPVWQKRQNKITLFLSHIFYPLRHIWPSLVFQCAGRERDYIKVCFILIYAFLITF